MNQERQQIVKNAATCAECGFEYSLGERPECPRCGAVRDKALAPHGVNRDVLYNPYDDEYRRIKAGIDGGSRFASDLENYLLTIEDKANGGDTQAQEFLGSQVYLNDCKRSIGMLWDAASHGNAHAAYCLALMYNAGKGVPHDSYAAIRYYRKAVAKGHPWAIYMLALCYSKGDKLIRDEAKATILMRLVAEDGYAPAQYDLSQRYYHGVGMKADVTQALMWCRLAADREYAPAEYAMARFLDEGEGVAADAFEATRWFERAAAHGDSAAMFVLSVRFCFGDGTKKNPERAFYLATKAVEQGFNDALWLKSYYFRNGVGVKENIDLADKFLFEALNLGVQAAWDVNMRLETVEKEFSARMKWAGNDIERLRKIYQWLRRCGYDKGLREALFRGVSLGDYYAENTLAYAYLEGQFGVEKNVPEAVRLYTIASDAGDSYSQYSLANLYHEGIGVERNLDIAEKLMQKSAEAGYVPAEYVLATWYWDADSKKAVTLLESAASKDEERAMRMLGDVLIRGNKVQRDIERGLKLLERAGQKGFNPAWVDLGDFFKEGKFVQMDYNKAFQCYEQAVRCNENDSEAFMRLAQMHMTWIGCWDLRKAENLLLKAIELGNSAAYLLMASLKCTVEEYKEAAEWFKKSWEAGDPRGEYNLALMYWRGDGFSQDTEVARRLAKEAVAAGAEDVEGLLKIENIDADSENTVDGSGVNLFGRLIFWGVVTLVLLKIAHEITS